MKCRGVEVENVILYICFLLYLSLLLFIFALCISALFVYFVFATAAQQFPSG